MRWNAVAHLFSLLIICYSAQGQGLVPIGSWRDHLPYQPSVQVIASPEMIISATPFNIFSIDPDDNSIQRLSKINGLSEVGIRKIAIDPSSRKIIIGYHSGNIDVVYEGNIINIDALKNSGITGDKSIRHIYANDGKAYISTGFGVLMIDLDKYEIRETYIIGNSGNQLAINAVTSQNGFLYAATDEGLKFANNTANLQDFRNWFTVAGNNNIPPGSVQQVLRVEAILLAGAKDSVYIQTNSGWNFFYADGWNIQNLSSSGGKILISETKQNTGRVVVLNLSGITEKIITDPKYINNPKQALIWHNDFWIADSIMGLSRFDGNSFNSYIPSSPLSVATGNMMTLNGRLAVAAGGVNNEWQPLNNPNGVFSFFEGNWKNYNRLSFPFPDTIHDILTVAIDPTDQSIWAGSFGDGLLNISSNNEYILYQQNSFIHPASFASDSYRVTGLVFDADNNLWISNYGANENLVVRKPDGTTQRFRVPFTIEENAVSNIVIDDANQKWIIAPKGNGLLCFNHGQSIDNTSDDQWRWFRAGQGSGNLPDNNVLSIAKDKNGFIWIGTSRGIGIVQCPELVFTSQGCEAILPVVQQGNFAGFLFRDQMVQTIATDGADRKWIGTANGVWLISSDGEKTIHLFTEDNSPLPGNDARSIAVDAITGEVFISTTKGIVSFRGEATEGGPTNDQVLVFPNPVPPGYTGTIAIRGLANNAIVKITETNGRLVHQTRANGGQATWNGRDYLGRQISSGIYLVLVSDDSRKENIATKIVFIRN